MKAIRVKEFGGPEVLRLEEVPDPQPGPGQVVVRIKAAGVNPVDTYIRAGIYPRKPPLPYTPGTDGAGMVESVGRRRHPRSRRATASTSAAASPERMRNRRCAMNGPCVRCRRIFRSRRARRCTFPTPPLFARFSSARTARGGETVLVHGASGGVGIAAVQLARAAGLRVIGTAGSDRGKQARGSTKARTKCSTTQRPDHFEKPWR